MSIPSTTPAATQRGPAPARRGKSRGLRWIGLAGIAAALLTAVGAYATLSRRTPEDPDGLWQAAQDALREHRIDDAERLLGRLSRTRPPTPEDWMLRGQVEIGRDRPEAAVEALSHVPDSARAAAAARLLAGQIELRRDHARLAEALLLQAIRLDPGLAQARRELIYIYGMQLRRRDVCEQFAMLSEISALRYENLFHWCLMRNCQWEAGEVAETLGRYIEADPDDRESRLALADNDRRLGLYAEAEEVLAPLPEDDVRAMALRVMILMDRREEGRAEELLARGPADDPELARLRGRAALARRDGHEALRYYQIAFQYDPSNRDAVFGLIHAHELCGEREKAVPLRRQAEALEAFNSLVQRMSTPEGRKDPGIMSEAARVCSQAGFIPEARAWLRLAIGRDPLDDSAQQALYRFNEQHPPAAATLH